MRRAASSNSPPSAGPAPLNLSQPCFNPGNRPKLLSKFLDSVLLHCSASFCSVINFAYFIQTRAQSLPPRLSLLCSTVTLQHFTDMFVGFLKPKHGIFLTSKDEQGRGQASDYCSRLHFNLCKHDTTEYFQQWRAQTF